MFPNPLGTVPVKLQFCMTLQKMSEIDWIGKKTRTYTFVRAGASLTPFGIEPSLWFTRLLRQKYQHRQFKLKTNEFFN